MAASISSIGLSASVLFTADHPLRRRFEGFFSFPVQQRNAPALAVRASSSSSSNPGASSGTRTGRGITKPRPVSPAMQALVGVPEIPRTQALKLIWAYIKEHSLQGKFLRFSSGVLFNFGGDVHFIFGSSELLRQQTSTAAEIFNVVFVD